MSHKDLLDAYARIIQYRLSGDISGKSAEYKKLIDSYRTQLKQTTNKKNVRSLLQSLVEKIKPVLLFGDRQKYFPPMDDDLLTSDEYVRLATEQPGKLYEVYSDDYGRQPRIQPAVHVAVAAAPIAAAAAPINVPPQQEEEVAAPINVPHQQEEKKQEVAEPIAAAAAVPFALSRMHPRGESRLSLGEEKKQEEEVNVDEKENQQRFIGQLWNTLNPAPPLDIKPGEFEPDKYIYMNLSGDTMMNFVHIDSIYIIWAIRRLFSTQDEIRYINETDNLPTDKTYLFNFVIGADDSNFVSLQTYGDVFRFANADDKQQFLRDLYNKQADITRGGKYYEEYRSHVTHRPGRGNLYFKYVNGEIHPVNLDIAKRHYEIYTKYSAIMPHKMLHKLLLTLVEVGADGVQIPKFVTIFDLDGFIKSNGTKPLVVKGNPPSFGGFGAESADVQVRELMKACIYVIKQHCPSYEFIRGLVNQSKKIDGEIGEITKRFKSGQDEFQLYAGPARKTYYENMVRGQFRKFYEMIMNPLSAKYFEIQPDSLRSKMGGAGGFDYGAGREAPKAMFYSNIEF